MYSSCGYCVIQVHRLYHLLQFNITPHYNQVCARRHGECIIDGLELLFDNRTFAANVSTTTTTTTTSSSLLADSITSPVVLPKLARCVHASDSPAIIEAMKSGLSFTTASQVEVYRSDAADNDEPPLEPEQLVASWIQTQRQRNDDDPECLRGLALKLRFHLAANDAESRQRSVQWQDAFIETMKVFHSTVIDVAFVAADSLQVSDVIAVVCMFFFEVVRV